MHNSSFISTGRRGKIQISQATAALLSKAGKENWIKPRKDKVEAKGLGILKTFWLDPGIKKGSSNGSSSGSGIDFYPYKQVKKSRNSESAAQKRERIIIWVTELLAEYLRKIVSHNIME